MQGRAGWWALLGIGGAVTAGWLGVAGWYVGRAVGWANLGFMLPHELAAMLAACSPRWPSCGWFLLFVLRGRETRRETRDLLRRLDDLAYPDDAAESRVARLTRQMKDEVDRVAQTGEAVAARLQAVQREVSDTTQELTGAGARATSQAEQLRVQLSAELTQLAEARREIADLLERTQGTTDRRPRRWKPPPSARPPPRARPARRSPRQPRRWTPRPSA